MSENDAYTLIGLCILALIGLFYYAMIQLCIKSVNFRIVFIALNILAAIITIINLSSPKTKLQTNYVQY